MLHRMNTTHPSLIGAAEACRLLGDINRSTLTRWVKAGVISPAARPSDKRNSAMLFDRSDVEALAASRESVAS